MQLEQQQDLNKKQLEKALTKKQLSFCKEYIKDFNGTDAYVRSKYSAKSRKTAQVEASKLLSKPIIKQYIGLLQKNADEKFWEYDMEYIVQNAIEILERCMQHKQVTDSKGNPVLTQTPNGQIASAYIFQAKTALNTLEFLARLKGYDKPKDGGDNSININITNYLQQNNQFNKYFPVTKETEHLAKMLEG